MVSLASPAVYLLRKYSLSVGEIVFLSISDSNDLSHNGKSTLLPEKISGSSLGKFILLHKSERS